MAQRLLPRERAGARRQAAPLTRAGRLILAGRTLNWPDPSQFGVVIFEADSGDEARKFVGPAAAVREQIMAARLFPFRVALTRRVGRAGVGSGAADSGGGGTMATGSELETARLRLRPCRAEDAELVHALWTDAHVRRFLFDDRHLSPEDARSHIEASLLSFKRHGYGLWLAFAHDGGGLVGFAGLLPSDEGAPNLIYGISPERCGHGYATEAARGVVNYALTKLGLESVKADVDEPNAASVRVLEKLGMRRVGRAAGAAGPLLYFEKSATDDTV